MFETERDKCHAIIHTAAAAAAAIGGGLAQIPMSDAIPLTGIQIGMIISIAAVYDVNLTEGAAKGLLVGFSSAVTGRGISQLLVGWIPVIGNAINATTAAGITEAIGWLAVKHFENLETDKKNSFEYGYKAGKIETMKKFKSLLEKLAENDQKTVLKLLIYKYILLNENDYFKLKNIPTSDNIDNNLNELLNELNQKDILSIIKDEIENFPKEKIVELRKEFDKIKNIYEAHLYDENKLKEIFEILFLTELKELTKDEKKNIIKLLIYRYILVDEKLYEKIKNRNITDNLSQITILTSLEEDKTVTIIRKELENFTNEEIIEFKTILEEVKNYYKESLYIRERIDEIDVVTDYFLSGN